MFYGWFELYTCVKTPEEVLAVSPNMITLQPNTSHPEVSLSICSSDLRDDTNYVRYYILLANFLVMALIPLLIMSVTNTLLYREVRRSGSIQLRRSLRRNQRDKSIALILIGIVIVFAFCNAFRIIINLYEVLCIVIIIGKYITGCPRFITFFSLEKFISTGRSGKLSYPRPQRVLLTR